MKKYFAVLFAMILTFSFSLLLINSFFELSITESSTISVFITAFALVLGSKSETNVAFVGLPCFTLSTDLGKPCADPLTAGTKEELLLINPSDIASITYDPLNNQIITGITLRAGTTGHVLLGLKNSNDPVITGVEGEFFNTIQQTINGIVFDTSFDVDTILNNLYIKNTPLVAIVRKRDKNDNGKREFRVFGIEEPLYLRQLSQTYNDTANGGAWVITLQNDDANSSNVPKALYDTNRATTINIYEALLPPVIPVLQTIAPSSDQVGATVILSGVGFTGATGVDFGTIAGTSFVVLNNNTISVIVPSVSTGAINVKVIHPNGDSNVISFTVLP